MSTTVTVSGVSYLVPNEGEGNWANNVSSLLIALATSSKVLQTGTSIFNLTSEVDFGATFGLKSAYWKSKAAAVSGTGALRLGNTEALSWRNAAGTGDLGLVANASDEILFNGVKLLSSNAITPTELGYLVGVGSQVDGISDARTLTNKTITVSSNTIITAASGNLSSTELNAALSELQGDIDTRANVNLSNLGVTSIAQNLIPNGTKTIGTLGSKWDFVYASTGLMGDLVYKTDNTVSLSPGTRRLNDTTGADVLDWSSYPKVMTEKSQLSSGVASAPTGSARDIYYNTSDNSYYYHNGTSWLQLSTGSLGGSGAAGYIPIFIGSTTIGNSAIIYSSGNFSISGYPSTTEHLLIKSPTLVTTTLALEATDATGDPSLKLNGSTNYSILTGNSSSTNVGNFVIRNNTTSTDMMTIKSSGNVGIGGDPSTNSLNPRLLLNGSFSSPTANTPYNGLYIASDDSVGADKGGVISLGGMYDGSNNTRFAAIAGLKSNATSGDYSGYLSFYTRENGSTPSERMRITPSTSTVTFGSELITNGDFVGSATGWTLGAFWSYNSNNVKLNQLVDAGTISQSITVTSGKSYLVSWVQQNAQTSPLSAQLRPVLGTVSGDYVSLGTGPVSYQQILIANTTGTVTFAFEPAGSYFTASLLMTGVSVKEILTQTSSCVTFNSSQTPVTIRNDINAGFGIGSGLEFNTSGSGLLSYGLSSLKYNTTGYNNTALGLGSLYKNTTGRENVGVGLNALYSNSDGYFNVAVGNGALVQNTSGISNTAIGAASLQANTVGTDNTAVGGFTLYSMVRGTGNVAIGNSALYTAVNGTGNTAVGISSMALNTGSDNVGIGNAALLNGTANNNTAIGRSALVNSTTGEYNTAVGSNCLESLTNYNNCSGLGYNSQITGHNQIQLGNSSTTTYVYGTVQNRSDIRDKTDIVDTQLGLEFLLKLRPVDYRWDLRDDYKPSVSPKREDFETEVAYELARSEYLENCKLSNIIHDGTHTRTRKHHGLIAQEVKQVLDTNNIDFGGFQDHKLKGGDDVLTLGYDEFIAPIVKAIQELNTKHEDEKQAKDIQIAELLARITALEN